MDKLLSFCSALAFAALMILMVIMSPAEAGPFWIFIIFTLLYVFFLGLAVMICKLFFCFYNKLFPHKSDDAAKRALKYGWAIALAPELAIILRSGGVFQVWQMVLIVVLECVICFIVAHRRA